MVRNYLPDPIDRSVAVEIATAALRAPSAGNSQGFAVILVTEEKLRREIAQVAGEPEYVQAGFDPWISRAPVHIVLSVSEAAYHSRYQEADKLDDDGQEIEWPVPFWWVDVGAAMMAVLLAAVDAGLAAGFLGLHSTDGLRSLLKIPEEHQPIGVITVGHPAPDRRSGSLARGQRPLEQTLHFETYSA